MCADISCDQPARRECTSCHQAICKAHTHRSQLWGIFADGQCTRCARRRRRQAQRERARRDERQTSRRHARSQVRLLVGL